MNRSSLTLFSFLLLGLECLVFAVFGLFILTDPALALVGATPVPTQEASWAAMDIPKPAQSRPQATPLAPTVEAPAATAETPNSGMDPVYEDSLFPEDGRWIDVNLSLQQMYAYEGEILVNTFTVSSGLPDTPTITGEYRIWVLC